MRAIAGSPANCSGFRKPPSRRAQKWNGAQRRLPQRRRTWALSCGTNRRGCIGRGTIAGETVRNGARPSRRAPPELAASEQAPPFWPLERGLGRHGRRFHYRKRLALQDTGKLALDGVLDWCAGRQQLARLVEFQCMEAVEIDVDVDVRPP